MSETRKCIVVRLPRVIISQRRTPNDQTSDLVEYSDNMSDSGAIQRIGRRFCPSHTLIHKPHSIPQLCYLRQGERYAIRSVCLSVNQSSLSVCSTANVIRQFHSLGLSIHVAPPMYQSEELINCWWWSCLSRIANHFSLLLPMHRDFLSASLYVSKRGAYWDRLCRDVVGRSLVGCHARALWPNGAS